VIKIETIIRLDGWLDVFKKTKTEAEYLSFSGHSIEEAHNLYAKYKNLRKEMAKEKWIQKAIKHPGALHKELGVPEGKKIPAKKLAAAAKKPGVEGKRARLAETLKKMH
jgi:hypothetical protein